MPSSQDQLNRDLNRLRLRRGGYQLVLDHLQANISTLMQQRQHAIDLKERLQERLRRDRIALARTNESNRQRIRNKIRRLGRKIDRLTRENIPALVEVRDAIQNLATTVDETIAALETGMAALSPEAQTRATTAATSASSETPSESDDRRVPEQRHEHEGE